MKESIRQNEFYCWKKKVVAGDKTTHFTRGAVAEIWLHINNYKS
jgi:hypothetical protein